MDQEGVVVLQLSREETKNLVDGVNLISRSEQERFVIYKDPDAQDAEDIFTACKNMCKHQGGTFIKDIEDTSHEACILKCTKHGWKLDAKSLRYFNPPESFRQEQLVSNLDENDSLQLIELRPSQPWENDKRKPETIHPGEVVVTYMSHACVEIKLGDKIMFTDPWMTGPAFSRGWWLLHEPPADWLDRLARADFIYISHLHSDHLSYPTLELLSKRNPNIPIYVGNPKTPVFCKKEEMGVELNNINPLNYGSWKEIDKNLRFMILMDGVHPEMDSCILIEYKGHIILNTVDCTSPNSCMLPQNVDILLSDFAGGASGFPTAFYGGRYTESWSKNFVKNDRKKLLYYKSQVVREVNPKLYCPFAGYFVEAHPSDKCIKEENTKNQASQLNALINKLSPTIKTWAPLPGACLDLGKLLENSDDPSNYITEPPPGTKIYKDSWEFKKYVDDINKYIFDEIFAYPAWIQFYYDWIGFNNYNLVLRMIETDEHFESIEGGYDYMVDFNGDRPTFPAERPTRKHNYLEMKNRIGVHREVIRRGLFWDNLFYGFQSRVTREPDFYHYLFWNHVQILLNGATPDWETFLDRQKSSNAPRKEVWKPSHHCLIAGEKPFSILDIVSNLKLIGPITFGVMAAAAYQMMRKLK